MDSRERHKRDAINAILSNYGVAFDWWAYHPMSSSIFLFYTVRGVGVIYRIPRALFGVFSAVTIATEIMTRMGINERS